MNILTLKSLWIKLLGVLPGDGQWEFWVAMHSTQTIEHGIKKTAQKNLATGNRMTTDHRLRFACAVMNSSTAQKVAGQRLANVLENPSAVQTETGPLEA
jgi:hypothetical protein